MSHHCLLVYIRTKIIYNYNYRHSWYLNNHKKFKVPNMESDYWLKSFYKWEPTSKLHQDITFAYDEFDYHAKKNIEISEKKQDRILLIKQAINEIVQAYKKIQQEIIDEPTNKISDFVSAHVIIDVSNFCNDVETKCKLSLLKGFRDFLKDLTYDLQFPSFESASSEYNLDKSSDPLEENRDFDSIYVVNDELYFFIYHFAITKPLALDPSHGIIDCAHYGFSNSLSLLHLDESIKELFENINLESEELQKIENKKIRTGHFDHQRKIMKLEEEAEIYEESLKENINISRLIYEGLNEPYDLKFEQQKELAPKVLNLLANVKALPKSVFQSSGLIEYVEFGGLKNIKSSVRPLKNRLKKLELDLEQQKWYGFVLLLIILALPIIIDYTLLKNDQTLSLMADAIQILTFIFAVVFLTIQTWPVKNFKKIFAGTFTKIKTRLNH